jgi:hypothetical protein
LFGVDRSVITPGGRSRFISGSGCISAMKTLIPAYELGRLLFCGEVQAGSVADIQARGCRPGRPHRRRRQQGLAAQTYSQVVTPPRKTPR